VQAAVYAAYTCTLQLLQIASTPCDSYIVALIVRLLVLADFCNVAHLWLWLISTMADFSL
jgi:hypothetical protein